MVFRTIGVYVSLLNDCAYCVEHHFQIELFAGRPARARAIRAALERTPGGRL